MNYSKIYKQLIGRGVARGWTRKSAPCYVEQHHILPRALGGTDDKSNLVFLTAKEHFVAHHLLWRIHRDSKTYWALICMMYDKRNQRTPFPEIPKLREKSSLFVKRGEDHPLYGVGHTDEAREKMSKSHTGKILSEETKQRMSKARQGNTCQSKGVYHTPNGTGRSLRDLANLNNCSETTIQDRCKRRPDVVITSKKLPKDWLGKTFREIGWWYEPD